MSTTFLKSPQSHFYLLLSTLPLSIQQEIIQKGSYCTPVVRETFFGCFSWPLVWFPLSLRINQSFSICRLQKENTFKFFVPVLNLLFWYHLCIIYSKVHKSFMFHRISYRYVPEHSIILKWLLKQASKRLNPIDTHTKIKHVGQANWTICNMSCANFSKDF